ncbi:hypothetical protein ACIRG4_29250 [Streptomyces sp. NPDC102395]|uniref:hypothetical protein n=1 Tax=Streptomyces sp. NPDC102395 TaxID=3366168 RepID=UPI0037FEC676
MPQALSIHQTASAAALALALAAWLCVLFRLLRRGRTVPAARGSAATDGTSRDDRRAGDDRTGASDRAGTGEPARESDPTGRSGGGTGGPRIRRSGERARPGRPDGRTRRVRNSRADSLRLNSEGWRRGAAARPADPAAPQDLPSLPGLPRQRQERPHLESAELTRAEQAVFADLVRRLTDADG